MTKQYAIADFAKKAFNYKNIFKYLSAWSLNVAAKQKNLLKAENQIQSILSFVLRREQDITNYALPISKSFERSFRSLPSGCGNEKSKFLCFQT